VHNLVVISGVPQDRMLRRNRLRGQRKNWMIAE
jgi:hypothetical protein